MNVSTPRLTCVLLVSIGSILVGAPVAGQQTRDEAIAAAQAEKATVLRPYVADPVERRVERVARLLTSTPTIYTYIGSVFPGGQLAVGPGVRKRYASTGAFDIHGGWSLKNYKLVDATLGLPDFADGRIKVTGRAQWIDAPGVAFYGIGPESPGTDPSRFSYRSATGGVSGRLQAARFVSAGGGIEVLEFETDRDGLRHSPVYTRGQIFGEIDWRQSPGYTTRGGLYRVGWSNYDEHANRSSSFRRLDVEVDQFVPLLRANWVLAFRTLASFTDVDDGNVVPVLSASRVGRRPQPARLPDLAFPRSATAAADRRISAGRPVNSSTWRFSSTPGKSPRDAATSA